MRYVAPEGAMDAETKELIKNSKSELIELLGGIETTGALNYAHGSLHGNTEYEASFAQQSLWLLTQLEIPPEVYAVHFSWEFQGVLDFSALEYSINALIKRHSVLRTVLNMKDGILLQKVKKYEPFKISVVDILEGESWEIPAAALIAKPFDLTNDLMLRVRLFRVSSQRIIFCVVTHHIVMDGWSAGLFVKELAILYKSAVSGSPSGLDNIHHQYTEYSRLQRQRNAAGEFSRSANYWHSRLGNKVPLLSLPFDKPRPDFPTYLGGSEVRLIDDELLLRVKEISASHGATPFLVFMAFYQAFLYRYTGDSEIFVGTPVANRDELKWQNQVGLFINTIVIRSSEFGQSTISDLIYSVKTSRIDALDYENLPFELLVQKLNIERHNGINPLFQAMFVYQGQPGETL